MAQGAASVSGKRLFRARFVPRTDGRRRGGDAGSDSSRCGGVVPCRGWQPRFYSAGAGLAVPPGRCRTWSHNCGVSGTTVYAREPAAMPRPYNEGFVPQESHRARQQTCRGSARSTDPRDYQRVGRPLGVMATTFPAGFVVAEHRHERAQLIHALSGVIELHVGRTLWLVRRSARYGCRRGWRTRCWRAARSACTPSMSGRSPARRNSPGAARVMVSPLLRELIVRAAGLPLLYDERGREGRLMAVLLDELEWSREQPWPCPTRGPTPGKNLPGAAGEPGRPSRAGGVGALRGGVLADPGTAVSLRAGSDLRPLAPPGAPAAALPRLAAGEAVARIAVDLGYQTPSAFSAMFRRLTGSTPSRYFALSDSA